MKTLVSLSAFVCFSILHHLFSGKNFDYFHKYTNTKEGANQASTDVPLALHQEDSRNGELLPTSSMPTEKVKNEGYHHEVADSSLAASSSPKVSHPDEKISATFTVPSSQTVLPIAENSTIASDIERIWHEPENQEICVALKPNARCPHPYFEGRLSGPGLAILDWNYRQDSEEEGTIMCGAYEHYWLDAGDYYVEIAIILCEDYGPSALERADNKAAWYHTFVKDKCAEDVRRNQITPIDGSAMIHVSTSQKGTGVFRKGRYVRKQGFPNKPLFEKSQPVECLQFWPPWNKPDDGSELRKWCNSKVDRDYQGNSRKGKPPTGIYEYEFQWNTKDSEETYQQVIRQRIEDGNLPKICGIGDSHTRQMRDVSLRGMKLKGAFDIHNFPYPHPTKYAEFVKRKFGDDCDIIFSQVGQWPGSYQSKGEPWTFGRYYEYVKLHVKNIIKANKGNPDVTFILPSMDYNPLSASANRCEDWRTNSYMEAFTLMNEKIAHDLNLELNTTQVKTLDNDFIVHPVWDSSPDWNHLADYVRERKTFYMLAVMLGYEEEWFLDD